MVRYLIIGIIVAIMETIMALVDLKKYGLTMGDIHPELQDRIWVVWALVIPFHIVVVAIVWPWQVYYWIRRIVKHTEVQ